MDEKPIVEPDPAKGGSSPPMQKKRKDPEGPAPTDDPAARAKAHAVNLVAEAADGAIQVDATVVGQGLGLEPPEVQSLMREGAITSVWERGIDDDAGRFRLTFFYKNKRLRLIINEGGRIMRRSTLDYGPVRTPWHGRRG